MLFYFKTTGTTIHFSICKAFSKKPVSERTAKKKKGLFMRLETVSKTEAIEKLTEPKNGDTWQFVLF